MATCDLCGRSVDLSHSCSYCEGTFCDQHRVPETHDCHAQAVAQPVHDKESAPGAEGIETPEPMDVSSARATSSKSSGGDSTPDVNPDGSLENTNDEWSDSEDSTGSSSISWTALGTRFKTSVLMIPRLLALAVVLLGAYNLLVQPFVGVEIYSGYRGIVLSASQLSLPFIYVDVLIIAVGSIGVWITTR